MEQEQKVYESDYFKNFKEYRCPGHKKTGYALDWNCNGKFLASADSCIKIWKLDNLALSKEKELKGHSETVESLAWHPKEAHILASTSKDGAIKFWDINKSKNSQRNEKTKQDTFLMSWSPDGQIIATGTKEAICFFDARTYQIINSQKFTSFQEITEFSWDPSGQIFLVTGTNKNVGLIQIFDGKNFNQITPLEQIESHRALISCIAFDQNEKYFATGANDSLVLVYDLAEMVAIKSFTKLDGIVKKLSFSHDSKYLATASEDDFIDIYNTESNWHSYRIKLQASQNAVKWHPKSYILAYIGEDKLSKEQEETTIHLFGKVSLEQAD